MISEMVETRDRIQNEFYEEFENMSQKFIGKPIDASVLYTLERYMEAVAQRIPLRMEYTLFRARSELTYPER